MHARFVGRLPIPPKWALALVLLTMLGATGCGTRHVAIPDGATGICVGKGKVAFPDKNGALAVGSYQPEAGDLIRRPRDESEVLETLKAAGVKVNEEAKP